MGRKNVLELLIAILVSTIISVVMYECRDIMFFNNLLTKKQHLNTKTSAMNFDRENFIIFGFTPYVKIADSRALEWFNNPNIMKAECTNNNLSFRANSHRDICKIS